MKMRLNRKAIRFILILLGAVLVLCAFFGALRVWERRQSRADIPADSAKEIPGYGDGEKAQLFVDGKWYTARDGLETVLLLGIDEFEETIPAESEEYTNPQQADFILLLVVDHENRTYTTLHLNRDTMTEMRAFSVDGRPGTITAQLALSHSVGSGGKDSCENTADAVSGLLFGAAIDHYVSLTMDAVAVINDLSGGVEVAVKDDFSGVNKPWKPGDTVLLHGSDALTYVRARGGMPEQTNTARMERQRQYLHALRQQVTAKMAESDEFLPGVILEISPYLVSDCTVNQLADIGNAVLEYSGGNIRTVEGEAVKGEKYMEFYPDEDALRALVLELFYTEA